MAEELPRRGEKIVIPEERYKKDNEELRDEVADTGQQRAPTT